jgi:hypothetical protein
LSIIVCPSERGIKEACLKTNKSVILISVCKLTVISDVENDDYCGGNSEELLLG